MPALLGVPGMLLGRGVAPEPTVTPSWIANGAPGGGSGASDFTAAYGTNEAGDLFVLCVFVRTATVAPTISGWTLRDGPDTLGNASHWWFTRNTRSTGAESGNVTINSRGSSMLAVIHTFRNVRTSSFIESLSAGGSAIDDTTVEAPTVPAEGNARLAVAAGGHDNDDAAMASFTGESGGDWIQRHTQASGLGSDCTIWLQTAALDAGGEISGGSHTLAVGRQWVQHGFALVGV